MLKKTTGAHSSREISLVQDSKRTVFNFWTEGEYWLMSVQPAWKRAGHISSLTGIADWTKLGVLKIGRIIPSIKEGVGGV